MLLEYDDIILKILYHTDIEDLLNFNKIYNICSDRYFWSGYFNKYDLLLPRENYTNCNEWIDIFNKSKDANNKTLNIIKHLDSRKFNVVAFEFVNDIILQFNKYLPRCNNYDGEILAFINKLKSRDHKGENKFECKVQISNIGANLFLTTYYVRCNDSLCSPYVKIEKDYLHNVLYPLIIITLNISLYDFIKFKNDIKY